MKRMTLDLTMSLEEFLSRPEVKPYEEYLHRRAIQKTVPSFPHSLTQAELARHLGNWAAERGGFVVTEQRCLLKVGADTHVVLPDVAFFPPGVLRSIPPGAVEIPPLLAVEVLSPDDVYGRIQDKVLLYLAAGVGVVWVIDPIARNVTLYRSTDPPKVLSDMLQDSSLEGFTLNLHTLFAKLG
ncbi:Uma2 family endonuclease [bacterium CPR1]|nr:Uma2 family endonuclease [bacterium CPR1]